MTHNNLQSEEIAQIVDRLVSTFIGHMHKVIGTVAMEELPADVINNETCMRIADRAVQRLTGPMREAVPTEAQHKAAEAETLHLAAKAEAEALRLQTFGPDKILGPEYAEHIQGVVIRAISQHAELGIVRERIADAVAEALTGKQMRPENSRGPKSFSEMLWEP